MQKEKKRKIKELIKQKSLQNKLTSSNKTNKIITKMKQLYIKMIAWKKKK